MINFAVMWKSERERDFVWVIAVARKIVNVQCEKENFK
jgi:hypothetical protein